MILFEYLYKKYSNNMTSKPTKGHEECKNGKGTVTYKNGNKYEGNFVDNKRHGPGTMTYANGDEYDGDWVDNKRHGKGTYTWADGTKYEGKWKNGKKYGNGTMKYSYKSDILEQGGRLENGKKVGSFVIGYKNGDIELQTYDNNRLLDKRIRFNILYLDEAYISKYDSRCTRNNCIRWTKISVEDAIGIAYNVFNIDMDKDETGNIKVFSDYGNEYPCNKYITGFLKKIIEIKMPLHYNINRREIEKNRNREIAAIIHQTSWDKRNSLVTYSSRVHR